MLDLAKPAPATEATRSNSYCFEHPVTFIHTGSKTRGVIDLYRAGHFVMEAKQGVAADRPEDDRQAALLPDLPAPGRGTARAALGGWDDTMLRARSQADGYARAVSRTDGWPPFLLVVDVCHVIEVYADFSGQGQGYTQYPDGNRYRITMDDLRDDRTRDRLRQIWTDPHALDPSKIAVQVTREVADRMSGWRDAFLEAGAASLKSRARDDRDATIDRLRTKVGELTLDTELLHAKIERPEAGGGAPFAARRSKR